MVRIEGTVRDWASCAQLSTGSCRPRQVRAPTPQITETLEGSQIFRTPRRVSSRRSSCGPPSTAASQQNTRKNSNNLIIIYNLGSSICLLFFLRLATVSLFFVSPDQPCLPSQSATTGCWLDSTPERTQTPKFSHTLPAADGSPRVRSIKIRMLIGFIDGVKIRVE